MKIYLIAPLGKMGQALHQEIKRRNEEKNCDQTLIITQIPAEADIVIDFSSPSGTSKALSLGKPLVCGTTSLDPSLMEELIAYGATSAVLYAPNFSLGIHLCCKLLQMIQEKIPSSSSISIEETHHIHKKDAPSGTALKMGDLLGIAREKISSFREEEVIGIHKVKFLFGDESLSLAHESFSRTPYAFGALEAAKFIFKKPPKFYTLDDLFG